MPTDRPAPLPANARIRVVNRVGRAIVNQLETTMPVQRPLTSPFTTGITQPPLTTPRPGQRLNVAGMLNIGANEAAPDSVSLWHCGAADNVFPLVSAVPTGSGNQPAYEMAGNAPGFSR